MTASPDSSTLAGVGGADYPRHWEADVLLRDGHTAHLRPVRPADRELLREFYSRVSEKSKYLRFFAPMPRLSEKDLTRFTTVDHRDRVALVMTVAEQMIAIGRYDVIEKGEAEVAFLVEDQHQGRGIAQLLLEHLAQAGRERGVDKFVAEVLPENNKMIQVFRDQGYQVARAYEEGVVHLEFPIDPTDTAIGVMADRGAPRRGGLDPGVLRRAQRRGDRAPRAARTRSARPWCATSCSATSPGGSTPSTSRRTRCPGCRRTPPWATSRVTSTWRSWPSPADAVTDVVLDCAAKGVHGLGGDLLGLRRERGRGSRAPAQAARPGPQLRAAPGRAELPGHRQHRSGGRAERLARPGHATPRPGRLLLPVRRARHRHLGEGLQPRTRAVHLRQRRQPRRRVGQRPAPVLGGGPGHGGGAALPRVHRQPTQVLPDRAAGLAAQAGGRRPLRGVRRRACRSATRCARWARRRPRSTRCSSRPAWCRWTPSRRCSTSPSCWRTSPCPGGGGSRSSATPTPSPCWPSTRPPATACRWSRRCCSAPKPPPATSRTPSTPRSTTTTSTPWWRSTSPR